ncbi:MAG: glutamate synthase subunit beta [Planctomycetia bacterium]|nr:glutamate synthase subunit beta [Planctomycetia bacterium]
MSSMNPKAFMSTPRKVGGYRPVAERVTDFSEVELPLSGAELHRQAERCMNCGIPFCHGLGCPLGNLIPDFNTAVFRGDWKTAWELLSYTSPFPEFTSRVCPALCEGSCTSGLDYGSVAIRHIERKIVDTAYENDWVKPDVPERRSGKTVSIIGSGPSGLAAAVLLNRRGHRVTVYEKDHEPGGLLRYGIPAFKLSKKLIDRRIDIMKASGIDFVTDTEIGEDVSAEYLAKKRDLLLIAVGTPEARDLSVPGRELEQVHFALDFLKGENRVLMEELETVPVSAKGQHVLVIGGGDTGSDCVGTSLRQGAASVTQIEIMPEPPQERSRYNSWPQWPRILRTSSSHEEGCLRRWNLETIRFIEDNQKLCGVEVVPVSWSESSDGRLCGFDRIGKPEEIRADLVLLALGFLKTDRDKTLQRFHLTNSSNVFFAGDAANGPSLVVRAIADGMKISEQMASRLE